MSPKCFVYTELQISIPITEAPWQEVNADLLKQPGLLNKTWLSGVGAQSLGGLYAFDSVEHAQAFVSGYFPSEAKKFGVAHTTRLFDATIVRQASEDLNSPHFGGTLPQSPGAFLYTELQVSEPFDRFPWKARNQVLKTVPGLLAKTWLSGLNTHTLGGLDAFDTLEHAREFALDNVPKTAAALNAAFTTRLFDASETVNASLQMRAPFFAETGYDNSGATPGALVEA